MLLDYGFAINKRGQYAGCGARSRFFHRFSLGTSTMKTLWVLAVEQKLNRESIKRFSGHTFLLCFTLWCDKEYSFLYGLQGDPFLCSSHWDTWRELLTGETLKMPDQRVNFFSLLELLPVNFGCSFKMNDAFLLRKSPILQLLSV